MTGVRNCRRCSTPNESRERSAILGLKTFSCFVSVTYIECILNEFWILLVCVPAKMEKIGEPKTVQQDVASESDFSVEAVEHDRHGDLQVIVGAQHQPKTHPKKFRVCSRTLSRSSPVFERMLYGSLAESNRKSSGSWTIDLPEDDPSAFELWSLISHGHFRQIPTEVPLDDLFHLTALTHYYDTTHSLSPWSAQWAASLPATPVEDEIGLHKLLWINVELNRKSSAAATARNIIQESRGICPESEMQQQLSSVPMSDTIRRLHDIRLQTISAMLRLFTQMSNILTVVDEKPRWCRHASYMGPHRCESMILGSIVFCLTRAGLWPIPPAEDVSESVLGLFQKLTGIVVHDIGQPERKGEDHSGCNPRQFLIDRLQRILAEIPDPLMAT